MKGFLAFVALVVGITALLGAWLAVELPRVVDRGLESFADALVSDLGPEGYADCGRIGDGAPVFSPGGTRIAFTHCEASGRLSVRTAPATGGKAKTMFVWDGVDGDEETIEELAWASDGRIAFVTGIGQPSSIRVWDPESGEVSALVGPEVAVKSGLTWSPDARWLAYVRSRTLVVADGRSGRTLRRLAHGLLDAEPSWSPDGTRIAFDGHGLWIAGAHGGVAHRLRRYASCSAGWRSSRLLVHVDPQGPPHLLVLDTTGRVVSRTALPTAPEFAGVCPATDSVGRRFTYVERDPTGGGVPSIRVLDVRASRIYPLTESD